MDARRTFIARKQMPMRRGAAAKKCARGFLLVALVLAACGGGDPAPPGGIDLSVPSSSLVEGFSLEVRAASPDPKNAVLDWSSSNNLVASVDQAGQVLGRAPGLVTIAARSAQTGDRATIELSVTPDVGFNTSLPIDAGQLAPTFQRACTVTRCEVEIHVSGIAATIAKGNARRYHRLELPQAGLVAAVGRPELPFYSLYFAIPVAPVTHTRATWRVDVQREAPRTYPGIRPWPHQPPRWIDGESRDDDAAPPFVVDEVAYSAQEAWPTETHWLEASEVGNLPLLEVKVLPLRYHASAGVLELYETTRVIVTFEGPDGLVMPRPLGDYKGIQEPGADEFVAEFIQNGDLVSMITSGDLLVTLPPLDPIGAMDTPFDCLIVAHDTLYEPALRLARWRQDHGTRVWLLTVSEAAYPDADSIRDAIRVLDAANVVEDAGGFRPRAMRAVLLFGDVEHIPTFEGRTYRNNAKPASDEDDAVSIAGTDLPYSAIRGSDDLPDVALGRISVEGKGEGQTVVDKIEAYEVRSESARPHHMSIYGLFDDVPEDRGVLGGTVRFTTGTDLVEGRGTSFVGQVHVGDLARPYEDLTVDKGAWPVRVAAVSSDTSLTLEQPWPGSNVIYADGRRLQVAFQDGRDDWMFLQSAERIRRFMLTLGVEPQFGYVQSESPEPAPTPTHEMDGRALHPDLLGYAWDCDTAEIKSNWRTGLDGFVLHSDHGSAGRFTRPGGWNHPWFRFDDLEPIPAGGGGWFPIVLSINCSSGWFDTETDFAWKWNPIFGLAERVEHTVANDFTAQADVSFCEQVLREAGGGGVAAIGASRGTTSAYNDKLIDGLFRAFYREYGWGGIPRGPRPATACMFLGDAVRSGKFVMYHWLLSPAGGRKLRSGDYNMQVYHLFGDPMLRMSPPRAPPVD